jgi:hypothetical protein
VESGTNFGTTFFEAMLREAHSQLERDGVDIKVPRRCDPEGHDGTRLPACFKVYLRSRVASSGWSSDSNR